MTKRIALISRLSIVCVGLALAVCSLPTWSQETTTLRLNLVISQQDPVYAYWEDFAQRIETKSDGTLKIKIYSNEALGNTEDMIQAVAHGAPILQDSDPSYLADYVPDYGIFMAPYLFKKPGDITKVWESDIAQKMADELHDKGLRIVTMVYFGTRNLMCDAPVHNRSDTADLKIRNAPTRMWNWVGTVLGGITVNTAWSEVYTALSEGLANCVESPSNVVYAMRFQEVLDYYILTQHLIAPTSIVMSQDIYESLPSKAQQALDEVGHSYPAVRTKQIKNLENEYLQKLADAGVTIIRNVDKSGFMEKAKHVGEQFPEWSPNLYQQIQDIID